MKEENLIKELSSASADLTKKILTVLLNIPVDDKILYGDLVKTLTEVHELIVSIDFYNTYNKNLNQGVKKYDTSIT
jgi:hypothetical protein